MFSKIYKCVQSSANTQSARTSGRRKEMLLGLGLLLGILLGLLFHARCILNDEHGLTAKSERRLIHTTNSDLPKEFSHKFECFAMLPNHYLRCLLCLLLGECWKHFDDFSGIAYPLGTFCNIANLLDSVLKPVFVPSNAKTQCSSGSKLLSQICNHHAERQSLYKLAALTLEAAPDGSLRN